jgi:amino acid adenylation domain-containing protein/non-ribosomal peptide synthase protein (TIGR01720 family)
MMEAYNKMDKLKDLTPAKRALLLKILQQKQEKEKPGQIQRRSKEETIVLSFSQERMWFLKQLLEESTAYTITMAVRMSGNVNKKILEKSFNTVINRHEVLRTTFEARDGKPLVIVHHKAELTLAESELEAYDEKEKESLADKAVMREAAKPFDLETGPLLRAALIKLTKGEHICVITAHHIVSDGWSIGILVRELAHAYDALLKGNEPVFTKLPIQYADYANWQRSWFDEGEQERLLSYWRKRLMGHGYSLELPADKPRPAVQSYQGAIHRFALPKKLSEELRRLGARENATLYMTLLAAFNVLLHRYSAQEDIIVGSPIANRNRLELEGLIGCFVNTLALRTDLSGNPTFLELLKRLRNNVLQDFEYQDMPFDKLVDRLEIQRDHSRQALYQVMFILQNTAVTTINLEGLTLKPLVADKGSSKFDLTLELYDGEESIYGWFEYNTDIFHWNTIQRLAENFTVLLESIVRVPEERISELDIMTQSELNLILNTLNDTHVDYNNKLCLHELFETQTEKTPEAAALVFKDSCLTYRELNSMANKLAHSLRGMGAGPETLVGVCMERSVEMVTALLAILKSGGAYVPIDPGYPSDRIAYMLEDSQVFILLTQQKLAQSFPHSDTRLICVDTEWEKIIADQSRDNPENRTKPENPAYMIYTSGSTGKPKGVVNIHSAICNRLLWGQEQYGLDHTDKVLQKTPFSFDISVWEFFWPLITGACLVMAEPEGHKDTSYLINLIEKCGITTIHFVPSMLQVFIEDKEVKRCSRLKRVICSGEALPYELRERFCNILDSELHNLYGPTEAAVEVTFWDCRNQIDGNLIPIGKPIANTYIYILDSYMRPVPVGVAGELYIAGDGLARGYWMKPELTAAKFVPNPFSSIPGQRLYKTGDLARFRTDGNIEFLGRIDHQVKIRGFRIELEEIEAVLGKHPTVKENVVIAIGDAANNKKLAAYLVANEGQTININELRHYLKKLLPEYMVPANYVIMEKFPLSPNGKLDRKAFPIPEKLREELENAFAAPETEKEKLLAQIWSDILGIKKVGINDDFFELGGDSILSIQVIARAAKFGIHFTPRQIFEHKTIAQLVKQADLGDTKSIEDGDTIGVLSLTPVQRWFFEQDVIDPHHFNQAMLFELKEDIDEALLEKVLKQLYLHHDALRLRFWREEDGWKQELTSPDKPFEIIRTDISHLTQQEQIAYLEAEASRIQASIELSEGCLIRCAIFTLGKEMGRRLLVAVHHLGIDGVSWRILIEDINNLYSQYATGNETDMLVKTTSFLRWTHLLEEYADSEDLIKEAAYWSKSIPKEAVILPIDSTGDETRNTIEFVKTTTIKLDKEETKALMYDFPKLYHVDIKEMLMTALALAFRQWLGQGNLIMDVEGHGREDIFQNTDISRTVGWFTSIYPLAFDLSKLEDGLHAVKYVKNEMRSIPNNGIGYGVLRYIATKNRSTDLFKSLPEAQVQFNYLGRFEQVLNEASIISAAKEPMGSVRSLKGRRRYLLEINSAVMEEQLAVECSYSSHLHKADTIAVLMESFSDKLRELINLCITYGRRLYIPTDFKLADLEQDKLNFIIGDDNDIEDIYPVSPMQNTILTYNLFNSKNSVQYLYWKLEGDLDVKIFEKAWNSVVQRHSILRTTFVWRKLKEPHQIVHRDIVVPFGVKDWSNRQAEITEQDIQQYIETELKEPFKSNHAPLMGLTLIEVKKEEFWFIWSYSNSLFDNWSWSVIIDEVFKFYKAYSESNKPYIEETSSFSEYIKWIKKQDMKGAEEFWKLELSDLKASPALKVNKNPKGALKEHTPGINALSLTVNQTAKAVEFGRRHKLTLSTILQGAWGLLLSRINEESDVLYGLLTSGRPGELKNVESMVGVFINTLPVRVKLDGGMDVLSWLKTLQDKLLYTCQYEYISIEKIAEWTGLSQNTLQMAGFERTFVYVTSPEKDVFSYDAGSEKDIVISQFKNTLQFNVPLRLYAMPGEQLNLEIKYNRTCFEDPVILRMLEDMSDLLEQIIDAPDKTCVEIAATIGDYK